jgi:hypothetical protein
VAIFHPFLKARSAVQEIEVHSLIAWAYLLSNATRVVTYLPQIYAVWRCEDGARSVSLMTWGSWAAANLTAVLYGSLVIQESFFVLISFINLIGCGAVTGIVGWRRATWQRANQPGGKTVEP